MFLVQFVKNAIDFLSAPQYLVSGALIGLVLLNGVFAMSEVALLTARRSRLKQLAAAGDGLARGALRLGDDPTRFLSTVQIGITSVSILNGIIGDAIFSADLALWLQQTFGLDAKSSGYLATASVVIGITYVSIVAGELVPKRLGQHNAVGIARMVAWPMLALAKASAPFVHLLSGSTNAILNPLLRLSRARGETSGVDFWRDGIATRGVLYDVPRLRGEPYVRAGKPIHAWDLEDAAKRQGVTPRPGDAVVIRGGLDPYLAAHPEGAGFASPAGVHASVLEFLWEHDASMLVWDMLDHLPTGYDIPWAVHACLFTYGVALLDNALLEPLARACVEEGRDEFMLMVAPLVVIGGTGSPANPLAVF